VHNVFISSHVLFFATEPAATEIYSLSPTRRSSDLQLLSAPKPTCRHCCRRHCAVLMNSVGLGTLSQNPDVGRLASRHARIKTVRSEEHTSELQSVSISYAVFCSKKKNPISLCVLPA